jgi:hypothetical protein
MCESGLRGANLEKVNTYSRSDQLQSTSTKFRFCSRLLEINMGDKAQI